MVVVAAKVVRQWACSLQLVVVCLGKCVNNGLWIFGANGKVINIRSNILIDIANSTHPDVILGLGRYKTHAAECVCKLLMPSQTT